MSKLTTDQKVELLARGLCKMTGIEVVDSIDGSSNWWLFGDTARKIIADLEERGFKVWDIDVIKPNE